MEIGTVGFEVELYAFPPESGLLDRVRAGEVNAELIQCVSTYFPQRRAAGARLARYAQGDAEWERVVDSLEEILAGHPGIMDRFCELGKRSAWLRWLLKRSARTDEERSLAVAAIRGDDQIHPEARATQGVPIRWTLPDRCEWIHLWLSELTPDDLRANFDPAEMERHHLYKWRVPDDPDEVFGWIAEDFASLQRLYREVTPRGEAVLVIED